MADPTTYRPGYSFTGFQDVSPSKSLPAPRLDDELGKISQAIDSSVGALKDIRRPDGKLQNRIVSLDSLMPEVRLAIEDPGGHAALAQQLIEEVIADTAATRDLAESSAAASVTSANLAKNSEIASTASALAASTSATAANGSAAIAAAAVITTGNSAAGADNSATLAGVARDQAQAARDAAMVSGQKYIDEPTGRAAVADGAYFFVVGSGNIACTEYKRINSSSSQLIAQYPSSAAVAALRRTLRSEEVVIALTDALLRRTWLEASRTDGGPTQFSLDLLLKRLDTVGRLPKFVKAPGIFAALADASGALTDFELGLDGKLTARSLKSIAPRLGPLIGSYVPEISRTSLSPQTLTNAKRISIHGASNVSYFGPQLVALGAHYGVDTYNGGLSGDFSDGVGARLGCTTITCTTPDGAINGGFGSVTTIIPASTGLIDRVLSFYALAGRKAFAWAGNMYGYIEKSGSTYHFISQVLSSNVSVPSDRPVTITLQDAIKHRNDVAILAPGNNDFQQGWGTANNIALINNAYSWAQTANPRILVHNHYAWPGPPDSTPWRGAVTAMNGYLASTFGDLVVDVHDLTVNSAIWSNPRITAAGITPTPTDLNWQAQGVCPPSLLRDGVHFNDAMNNALLDLTISKIDSLGWEFN